MLESGIVGGKGIQALTIKASKPTDRLHNHPLVRRPFAKLKSKP
jgi:hypothetical protein